MAKKGKKKMKKGGCVIHAPVTCKQITKHHNPEAPYHKKGKKGKRGVKAKAACVMRYAHRTGTSLKQAWRKAKGGLICVARRKGRHKKQAYSVLGTGSITDPTMWV